jgi:hypothetical protein
MDQLPRNGRWDFGDTLGLIDTHEVGVGIAGLIADCDRVRFGGTGLG